MVERKGTKVTRTGRGRQFVGRNPASSSELRFRERGARVERGGGRSSGRFVPRSPEDGPGVAEMICWSR